MTDHRGGETYFDMKDGISVFGIEMPSPGIVIQQERLVTHMREPWMSMEVCFFRISPSSSI
jgi:hypothetical protein